MGLPLVSIGMPVFNAERTIESAIRSVILQSFHDWELLAIDDGSSDRSCEILRRFGDPRIRVVRDHAHDGLPQRLNLAIAMSRGRYFARMDSDDVCYPDRIQFQLQFLETHPDVDLVGGAVMVFGDQGLARGKRAVPSRHREICRRPWAGFPLPHPTWMGKKEWFERHLYRPFIRCEDQELLLRTYRSSCFANVDRIILGYREQRIRLRRVIRGRRSWVCALWAEPAGTISACRAVGGTIEQIAKGMVDTLAVASGLEKSILCHRAQSVTWAENAAWNDVWASLSADGPRALA
jgi:glycosyltransferase involved in cell wall biosynthesis